MKPACMDDSEYLAWQEANQSTRGFERADTPCRDCLTDYHREMIEAGTCDGKPGPRPPGRELIPTTLRYLSHAELQVIRRSLPKYGPPAELVTAMHRARWREYQQRRRDAVSA